jgi:hypothetical protein
MLRRILLIAACLIALSPQAKAADSAVPAMTAAGAIADADLLYCVQSAADRKCTPVQLATYIFGKVSGSLSCTSGGACTVVTNANLTGDVTSSGNTTTYANVVPAAKGGAGTVTGALKANGAGLVTQAACADLSNGATGCSTAVGTSGATIGLLNAANTWSNVQTFNANQLLLAGVTGSTQCLQASTTGVVTGTGAVCGGAGSTGANPTATAGDVAVNGVATTFMRSDGAPAIQKTSASVFGLVKVDGTTLTATGGVASVGTGCGLSTSSAGVIANATINAQVGTSYTVLSTDCGVFVSLSNASAIAVTLPQATGSFTTGWYSTFTNIGAGTVTITPTTSTIDGAASLTLKTNQSVDVISNGTNYITARGRPSSVACADLTNSGTACTAATGTSGATLPFLNGTNTFSGTQTFGSVFGTVTTQSGTTYTLASTDCGTEIAFTNAAAVTVTIPATLTTGCNIAILQTTAAGQVTVTGTAVSAATLHSGHAYTKTFGQWSIIGINIYTTGVAILTGDGA